MKGLLFGLVGLVLLVGVSFALAQGSPVSGGGGSPIEINSGVTGAGDLVTNLDTNNFCIENTGTDIGVELCDDLYTGGYDVVNNVALTGDVAPVSAYESLGGNASPYAVTGASQIGAASSYRGGCGTTNIKAVTCSAAGAGATVTLAGYTSAGAAWTETYTEGAVAPLGWARGASEAACATNLAATIDAAPIAGLYVDASAAGVGGAFVGIQLKPGMNAGCPTISTNAVVGVLLPVNGADGKVAVTMPNYTGAGIADGTSSKSCLSTYYGYQGFDDCGSPPSRGNLVGNSIWASGSYIEANTYSKAGTYVQAGTDLYVGDDYLPTVSAVASDAAPVITTYTTEEPYANAAVNDATNTTGGNEVHATANGSRRLAGAGNTDMCGGAACTGADGTTLITIPTQTDGVTTNCVLTHGAATAAGVFHCDGHTAADCAASVKASMTVSPCTLITTSVATNGVLAFTRVAGSVSYLGPVVVTAGGGSNITAENGTDGQFIARSVQGEIPGCVRLGSSSTYVYGASNNVGIGQSCAAVNTTLLWTGEVHAASTITSSSTTNLGWHIVSAANQSCETTCTNAAVFGWDGTTPVNHDDATADTCVCAGAN